MKHKINKTKLRLNGEISMEMYYSTWPDNLKLNVVKGL